jgi:hypothetical protein
MRFEFATSNRILFGAGIISEVPSLAASFGQRAVLVTDSLERCSALRESLLMVGLSVEIFLVQK